MELIYKEWRLTKTDEKPAGKNIDPVNGFYKNTAGDRFFVKRPTDLNELVAEYMAGQLLQAFINEGIISPEEEPSFICADIVQIDEKYALIQPCVEFTPLCMLIGTNAWGQRYRSAWTETFYASDYYAKINQMVPSPVASLAPILFFSLLIGDKSVHSDNVVRLLDNSMARIDFGAAFRDIGREGESVLHPYEYQGLAAYKLWSKNYFASYKRVLGLHQSIKDRAKGFLERGEDLESIIQSVISKIDAKLLTPAFFNLMGIQQGNLAPQLARLLITRATDISNMPVETQVIQEAPVTESSLRILKELDALSENDIVQEEALVRELITQEEQAILSSAKLEREEALVHEICVQEGQEILKKEADARLALLEQKEALVREIITQKEQTILRSAKLKQEETLVREAYIQEEKISRPAFDTPGLPRPLRSLAMTQAPNKHWKISAGVTGAMTSIGFAVPAILFSKIALPATLLALGITAFPFAGIIGGGVLLIGAGITFFLKIKARPSKRSDFVEGDTLLSPVEKYTLSSSAQAGDSHEMELAAPILVSAPPPACVGGS